MNKETMQTPIKRDLALGATIMVLLVALFFVFSRLNQARIIRQNEGYVQDNARQTVDRLDEVLSGALNSMEQMAFWFGASLTSPEVTAQDLAGMTAHSDFDYVRYVDAQGINITADGRSNDATDRHYYLDGMAGHSGISVIMESRITSETLINFYTPLYHDGQIIGVLRGVYLADRRMKELLNTSFFGVPSATFLCAHDGSIIACSEAAQDADLQELWVEDPANRYVSGEDMLAIRSALANGTELCFTYRSSGSTGNGYITPLGHADMLLVQTFPAKVTGRMYSEAIRAGVFLVLSLVTLFAAYIVTVIVHNQRQKRRLMRENRDMNYIIHGVPMLFEGFVLVDLAAKTFRFLLWNESHEEALPEEGLYADLVAHILSRISDGDERAQIGQTLDVQALRDRLLGGVDEFKLEYPEPEGNGRWHRLEIACLERENGVASKVLLAEQDISDIKREELSRQDELLRAMETAREASRAKSTFLFNMSHDIRTPMNAIIGFTDLARTHVNDREAVLNDLQKIRSSSDVLLRIINDILDLARIESGKTTLHPEPSSIIRCMDTVRDMFTEGMRAKDIAFTTQVDVQDAFVVWDELRIHKILINLLSNAQKFTPSGGHVSMCFVQTAPAVCGRASYEITVQDDGIGISESFMPRLFGSFERERTSTVAGINGTGLGLSIVKHLVDMMGGSIDVTSAPGEDSTFTVRLTVPVAADGQPVQSEAPACGEASSLTGRRILLAEDNELNLEIAQEILMALGAQVSVAHNGEEALHAVMSAAPGEIDAVLMDIQMPVMDGYEAARAIRALDDPEKAGIPIVAMTANAFDEDRRNAFASGMNEHISKPVDSRLLARTLTALLQDDPKPTPRGE